MYAKALTIETYCKRSMAACAALIALSAFLYGAFLLIAVEKTAHRSETQARLNAIAADVSASEGKYLAMAAALTPAKAAELGFTQPRASSIIYANAAERLTLRDVRP